MRYRKYKLSDICELQIGRTPPRIEHEWFNNNQNDYTWVSIKDLGTVNKYIGTSSETISIEGQKKFNIPVVKSGTLLLSFKLTIGKLAIATKDLLTNEAIAQLPLKDKSIVDNEFLYYYLKIYPYETLGSTSSIATAINSKILKNMDIELPDIDEQRKIASVLKSIDDKIELNNKINKNLEEQVDSLYKKVTNNSDVKIVKLSSIAVIGSGKRPIDVSNVCNADNEIPLIGASSIMGYVNNYNYYEKVLVTGRVGTHGIIQRFNKPIWASDNTLVIKTKYYEFLYQVLKNVDWHSMNRGSTQPLITQSDLNNVDIILPNDKVLNDFESNSMILMNKYEHNILENEKLIKLRDSLLPKLMSGEIDVSKINI